MTETNGAVADNRLFDRVLVANRGEIACRVIDTLRRLGIRSVAVYSDADADARHVALADESLRIGPAAPNESYLNIEAIVGAALATHCQAIHPGYGFLSENAHFAEACEAAGLVFVGPGVNALAVMGDKIRSKNHVAAYGVPVTPGIAEPGLTDEQLIAAAGDVGYPLLIKPSAGGGGKGMEEVESADQLPAALATARRIARSSFGDDTLFLERLITEPRHIEVQVLADNYGNVIHLGERECSLQRRHQKVIEEAPSALLDEATRERIGQAACRAAASVQYRGAGTVEFLVSQAAPDEFFFMEMNTRLQVEHPVTEMVTGIDLVEQQLRIAAGHPLASEQPAVQLSGHAIEARVYAENPERGFLPSAGRVLVLEQPTGEGVRVDSALVAGLTVGSDYDPMLAKVIAWGTDRAEALTRLDAALADTVVLGVPTNIEYLRLLLADADVQAGNLDTGLIERRVPDMEFRQADARVMGVAALYLHSERWGRGRQGPWQEPTGWRAGGVTRPCRYPLMTAQGELVELWVGGHPRDATITLGHPNGAAPVRAAIRALNGPAVWQVTVDGVTSVFRIVRDGESLWLGQRGFSCRIPLPSRAEELADRLAGISRAPGAANPDVRAPMPGTVVAVEVRTGDLVEAGQTLLTIEAMKMEHKLKAQLAGVVTIDVQPGDLVSLDQVVAQITEAEPQS
ncbi:biotin carboxylase N-terminal domain-containing protein [Homoserinimonas sp. OAct 916]|uniref:ATP-binding protein n=1 Tax=Homoserinimonas sp. OAct 916 TaxID=2211450 RepID=UPI000DBE3E4F|nr:biotin carboxylase N-terminal domain-containing protein [Homoserinimonas sp. OAct 916]